MLAWQINMKQIKIAIVFLLVLSSCASLKEKYQDQDLYNRLSKGFVLEKLPNWTFHGYHAVLNFTPTDLMDKGKKYMINNVTAYKSRKPSKVALEKSVGNQFKNGVNAKITNLKTYTAETKYGTSIVATYDASGGSIKSKAIWQFYKYKGYVYKLSYTAEVEYFDTYYEDALKIMKTFKIVE